MRKAGDNDAAGDGFRKPQIANLEIRNSGRFRFMISGVLN
jgi:hypothetical protein